MLRLTPTWVPRSFLHPGRRIKLNPADLYAFGANRGGIDERWFSSTTEAANEGRVWHEGLSFCLFEGKKFLLRDAVSELGDRLVGKSIFGITVGLCIRSSSTIWDQFRTTCINRLKTRWSDKKESRESYYFRPQYNNVDNNFCYTFMGLHARYDEKMTSVAVLRIGTRVTTVSSTCREAYRPAAAPVG
ncbi:MAG: hypothetical protein U0892_03600 [Pirellulales bacterium]